MVRELLLGDNAFIGVSHLCQEKAKEEDKECQLENKANVVRAALKGGATGFTFSSHESNLELLTYFHDSDKALLGKMNYYILVPYSQSYVRKSNVDGTPALIKSKLREFFSGKMSISDALVSLLTLKLDRLAGLFLESELIPYFEILPRKNIKGILLHEVLTELFIAFDLMDSIKPLERYMNTRFKVGFGLETRNFSSLSNSLKKSGHFPEYIMTPINRVGYQMAESKDGVENAIKEVSRKSKIIAINILASGIVSLDQAIEDLKRYEDNIYAITTASSKPNRAFSNFQKLSQIFLVKPENNINTLINQVLY